MGQRRFLLAALTLTIAVAFVYHRAVSAYFFDDDFQWLVGTWSFEPQHLFQFGRLSHFYRPVIDLYFALATPLFGGSPALFHLANIVLHAVNGVLVLVLARELSRNDLYAFVAALCFVVLPGYVEAIAWVSALAEAVMACFGCICLYAFLRFRAGGRRSWQVVSLATFGLALLTHESSVVIFPLLLLAEWAFVDETARGRLARTPAVPTTARLRLFVPHLILLVAYLLIDLPINHRSYLVNDGYYRIGLHAVRNVLDYIVTMFVGRRDVLTYAAVAVVIAGLLLRGSRRVVFATCWMIGSLLPFAFFTWGNTSRYLYLPSIGFAMLLAEMVVLLRNTIAGRVRYWQEVGIVAVVVTIIAARFMFFAADAVRRFANRTDAYRSYIASFRQTHGSLEPYTAVRVDPDVKLPERFVVALIQWEYRDPTIALASDPQ